jgi:hypothetical protein
MVNEDRMLSFESKLMELNSRVLELETIGAAVSKQLDSLGHETDSENEDDIELAPERQPRTKLGKAMLAKVQRSVSPGSRKSDDKTVKLPDINKRRGVNSRSPSPKKKFVPVDMTEHPNLACINYCDYKVDIILETI